MKNKVAVELVNSKRTKKSWLENKEGKRITKKFHIVSKNEVGNFILLKTSKGSIVYNLLQEHILFEGKDTQRDVYVYELSDNLYCINYRDCKTKNYRVLLYTKDGRLLTDIYNSVAKMGNGLIAVKEDGIWGFIDDKANLLIKPTYFDVKEFDKYGYSVVRCDVFEYAIINKNLEYVIEPMECAKLEVLSEKLVKVYSSGKQGIISIDGKCIVPTIYASIDLKGEFLIVKYNTEYGILNTDGSIVFDCIYPKIIETPDKFVVQDFDRKELPKTKSISKKH